jgi:hypothetical protein
MKMLKKQEHHLFFLIILLLGVYFLATGDVLSGQLWGISTQTWLWIAVGTPVLHQIIVALLWRAELYHNKMTRWFGDQAFTLFKVIFTILFVGRPVTLILLGISNAGTLNLNPVLAYILVAILLSHLPTLCILFSLFWCGPSLREDHFKPASYKDKPFVKQGMFQYTDNAMYKFGFLILWAIALVFLSKAALLAAAFNHLYIWVHYYFTELPDIQYIYGRSTREPA